MTTSISSDYDAVNDGTEQATSALPDTGTQATPVAGVDPRLVGAVDDTAQETGQGRDEVEERGERTRRYTHGLEEIQDEGERDIESAGDGPSSNSNGLGSSTQMPQMPQVPQQSTPQPAQSPQMSMPQMTPPAGVQNIDPSILAALIEAVQQEQASSNGEPAELGRDPDRLTPEGTATTPQSPDPLDVSEVSLDKYAGGVLSQDQVADVVDQALTINGIPNDPALREQWQQLYQHMAQNESGNNPNAVNNWDSNATGAMMEDGGRANSSRGIWQCIPSTFAAYHMGGTSTSIYDPTASAAASINYVMQTYGVSSTGDGLTAFMSRQGVGTGSYQGY